LPTVAGRQQASDAVQACTDVIAVVQLGRAGVQGDPHLQWSLELPVLGVQTALSLGSRCHSLGGGRKCRTQGIAHRAEDLPAVGPDGLAQDGVVPFQGQAHGVRLMLPQAGAAFDICI
jgi:hypothetical protein